MIGAVCGQRIRSNLPRRHLRQWRQLVNDPRIFIIPADKGGRTVLWKREDYIKEAERTLGDSATYKELTKEEAARDYENLRRTKMIILRRLRQEGCITASEERRLESEENTMSSFYILPKIHKDKRPDTGTFPGRPITAATNGLLKSLDQFLADTTSPLLRLIPGSLIDTAALLRDAAKLVGLSPTCQLFSADVESLYPSIPWTEGIKSAVDFYAEHFNVLLERAEREGILPPPSPALFGFMLKAILENNIFHFQERRWFRQLKGTAMGCSMSVFIANTFMYSRTRHLLENPPRNLKYLGRYIDDLIGVWDGPTEDIPAVFNRTVDKDVRLTYVYGGKSLEALDVVLELEPNGSIETRLFRKPTDGHQYVHWTSAHPEKLKSSIPYAQLLRIKRNCSRSADYHREAAVLLNRFRSRGYPESVLEEAYLKAETKERAALLITGKPSVAEERMNFVTDNLNGAENDARRILRDFYGSLEANIRSTEIGDTAPWPLPIEPPRLASRVGRALGGGLGPLYKKGPRNLPDAK